MTTLKTVSTRRAKRHDRVARWVITLGGILVIASVIAILALIVGVTVPLFRSPQSVEVATCRLPDSLPRDKVLRLGVDMDIDGAAVTGTVWMSDGGVAWLDLRTGAIIGQDRVATPDGGPNAALCNVEPLGSGKYSLSWTNGGASLVEVVVERDHASNTKASQCSVRTLADISVADSNARPLPDDAASGVSDKPAVVQSCVRRSSSGAITRAAWLSDGTIAILRRVEAENLLGDKEVNTHEEILREDVISHVRVMTLDREGNTLYAGTDDGRLIRWQFDDEGKVAEREVVHAYADGRTISALAMVLGDVSLAVGDSKGQLTTWSPVSADGVRKLRAVHRLTPHKGEICEILPSGRNKSILSVSGDGNANLDHMTSERHLLSVNLDDLADASGTSSIAKTHTAQAAFGPRGDALLGLDASGKLTAWRLESGCPEISFTTLFGKVLYEGYDAPEYVWQTTGGEEFEPKYSLVPLLFGTLKGTFYAMLFAVPFSLFGAMYVSYFTTPGFRKTIKPAVEIMATVPSVVIGFLIALWLAPIIERWLLAFFTSLLAVPMTFVAFMVVWQLLRRFDWARQVENGYEFLVVLPVLLIGVVAAVCLATPLEAWLFDGNFRRWLFEGPLAMQCDQRNSIIIAFGLGFTVIPIIFSIAEDSLSNVPYSMTAASMAVGASRWQTLWRVVLPSASPGIFAALMIGFGRAVGETMIVLMATGNTPILDWSPLNGMRTLSANIAVEIPEAPVGGTLYRVLFLCAVLLFLLTFTVNTSAELVRQRLRKRFGRF